MLHGLSNEELGFCVFYGGEILNWKKFLRGLGMLSAGILPARPKTLLILSASSPWEAGSFGRNSSLIRFPFTLSRW